MKKPLQDPKTVPFANIFFKCAVVQREKSLIVVPDQGLEPQTASFDDMASLAENTYYQGSLVINPEGKGYLLTAAPVAVAKPGPAEIKASEKNTIATKAVIKGLEADWEKQKIEEFKKEIGIAQIPDDLYISDKVWNLICASVKLDKYILLLGPKGCGKTQTAQELAKAIGHKFCSFNMGAAFKPKQMFAGMLQAEDGNTVFIESEFLKAFQSDEPMLIFLDELTRTPQVATNYLMTILDRNQSYIYVEELGKRFYRGKGVRFICAGNVGSQYTDTRTIDGAFWDRFIKLPVDYLPKAEEEKLIMKRAPKANPKNVKVLIDRAHKCREAEKAGSITSGISTRQLIDMAHYLEMSFTVEEVFENIFLNNFINGNNNEIDQVKLLMQS